MSRGLADRLVRAVESRDAASLAALFQEDAVLRHPLSEIPTQGRAAIAASEQVLFDAFSDIVVEVVGVVTDPDTVVIELVLRATHTGPLAAAEGQVIEPSGRRIEMPAVWVLKVGAGGLVREERDYLDSAAFFRQLGL